MISSCDGRNANTKDSDLTSDEHGNGWGGFIPDNLACMRIGRWGQRVDDRSRMNREVHVRFWEGVEVKFFRATQLIGAIRPRARHCVAVSLPCQSSSALIFSPRRVDPAW